MIRTRESKISEILSIGIVDVAVGCRATRRRTHVVSGVVLADAAAGADLIGRRIIVDGYHTVLIRVETHGRRAVFREIWHPSDVRIGGRVVSAVLLRRVSEPAALVVR